MARFLALDWDHQQLHVVSANVKHGSVHIQRAVVWQEPQSPNLAEAEALGRRLRELLKAEGIAPAPVLACIGRDRVILKEISFPPVPEAEEPAIVRFQAIKELSHAPEEVVIDYVAASETGPSGERRAFVLILRRELLTAYQTLCKAAGLNLAGITPRPFGTAFCLKTHSVEDGSAPPEPRSQSRAEAVLTVAERWAEFCVAHNGELLFARSLTVPAGGSNVALLQDIRRNLAVYSAQSPRHPIRALYVAGGEPGVLRDQLRNALALPVHDLDPLVGVERLELPPAKRGAFTGAVGLLQARSDKRAEPINFLRPKEPKPPRDPNQWRGIVAAAVILFVIVTGIAYGYSRLAARDRELKLLQVTKMGLDAQLAQAEDDSKRIKALSEWVDNSVVWLDELYDLTDRVPDINGLRLTQLSGEPVARTAKTKHIAKLSLKGLATNDSKQVDELISELAKDSHYRVEPKVLARNSGLDRFRFSQQFTTRMEMEKRPPEEYVRRLRTQLPAGDRNRDDGLDMGFGGFGEGMP